MDISEVIPGLYIASRFYPVDDQMPDSVPIDCAAVLEDSPDQSTMPIEVLARVTFGLLHDGLAVTLFCDAGRNRSAVVAARALIIRGHTPANAISLVRQARSHLQGGALTNQTFVEYLLRAAS